MKGMIIWRVPNYFYFVVLKHQHSLVILTFLHFFFFLRTECNIVQFLLLQFLSGMLKTCGEGEGGGGGGGREHANIGDFQKGGVNFSWWRLTIYMLSYNKKILCIQAECRCF